MCINNVTTAYSHEQCTWSVVKYENKKKVKDRRERERENKKEERIITLERHVSILRNSGVCPLSLRLSIARKLRSRNPWIYNETLFAVYYPAEIRSRNGKSI